MSKNTLSEPQPDSASYFIHQSNGLKFKRLLGFQIMFNIIWFDVEKGKFYERKK